MISLLLIFIILVSLSPLNKNTIFQLALARISSIIIIFSSFLIMKTYYIDRIYNGVAIFYNSISVNSINQKFIITPISVGILIAMFLTTSVSGSELLSDLTIISFFNQIILFNFFIVGLIIISLASVYSVIFINNAILDLQKKIPTLNQNFTNYCISGIIILLFLFIFFILFYYFILIVLLPYLTILFVKLSFIFFALLHFLMELCFTVIIEDDLNKILTASLVIWGTNLSSNVGSPRFSRLVSDLVEFPHYVKSILYGLLLSDGWLAFSAGSKNARFGFNQSLAHFEYCWHVFCLLAHYCKSYPNFKKGKRLGTWTFALEFCTRSLSCFTELHNLWYKNGIKVVPVDIFDYLTPIALAHWIMGDGASHKFGLILCTDSFSVQDVVRLMNVLMIKYDINSSAIENRPGQYRIYISQKSMDNLRGIVLPYFVPSMLYKIKA